MPAVEHFNINHQLLVVRHRNLNLSPDPLQGKCSLKLKFRITTDKYIQTAIRHRDTYLYNGVVDIMS